MSNSTSQTIYYLPGYGGQLATGLGRGLMDRGFDVAGRETRGDFRSLLFDEQIQTVMLDLQEHFWREQARVVCNSFGACLFLHAQTQMIQHSYIMFCSNESTLRTKCERSKCSNIQNGLIIAHAPAPFYHPIGRFQWR
jgi:hypothetical protein